VKKICILYGGAEGKLISKKLRKELVANDFSLVTSPYAADLLICHSAGIFFVPKDCKKPLILSVGMPCNTNGRLTAKVFRRLGLEFIHPDNILPRVKKLGINIFYLFDVKHLSRSIQGYKRQIYNCTDTNKVVTIVNKKDPFVDTASSLQLSKSSNWVYISMPGQHDDLWIKPKPYVEIIKVLMSS